MVMHRGKLENKSIVVFNVMCGLTLRSHVLHVSK